MKDSGIPWVGEIPEDWETRRLKYLLSERNSRTATGDEELLSVSIHDGVVPSRYIRERTSLASSLVGYKHVLIGDMVFNKLNPNMARFAYSEYEGITSPDFAVYYPKEPISVDMRFLTYLIRTPLYVERIKQLTSGVGEGFARLYTPDLFGIAIGLPLLDEQQRIADFLDTRCGEIDAVKQTLSDEIEALQRFRKAMIDKAFSKDWKKCHLGFLINDIRTGLNPRDNFKLNTPDAENYYVTIREMVDGWHIRPTEKTDLVNDEALRLIANRSHLRVGDVLVSGTASIGKTALVSEEPINWNIKEGIYAVTTDGYRLIPEFLIYWIGSTDAVQQLELYRRGSTVESVTMDKFCKLNIPYVDIIEQQQIVDYLDERCAAIDSVIETRTKQLERLEDYRKALVFAYVTGKKEVPAHE